MCDCYMHWWILFNASEDISKTIHWSLNIPWTHSKFRWSLLSSVTTLIARFMRPTWAHLGPTGPRWAPCWPHEPCYLENQCDSAISLYIRLSFHFSNLCVQVPFSCWHIHVDFPDLMYGQIVYFLFFWTKHRCLNINLYTFMSIYLSTFILVIKDRYFLTTDTA